MRIEDRMSRIAGVFNRGNALRAIIRGFEALGNVELRNAVCDERVRNCIATSGELKNGLVADAELYRWEGEKGMSMSTSTSTSTSSSYLSLLDHLRMEGRTGRVNLEGIEKRLDGGFAFALWSEAAGEVLIARDVVGIKPLWFVHVEDAGGDVLAFASERKMLEAMGFTHANLLEPRTVLHYRCDRGYGRLRFEHRASFYIEPELSGDIGELKSELLELIRASIKRRIPEGEKFGVLFSGGLDSTLIAYLCRDLGAEFCCYTVGVDEPGLKPAEDLEFAERVAASLGFELRIKRVRMNELERYLKVVIPSIEDTDVVKVSVALPLYVACEFAMEDGISTLLYGLGTEELFAGYERHKRVKHQDLNEECLAGLMRAYERDLYRDDVIARSCGISLRAPFLAPELVEFGLRLPARWKLSGGEDKFILREIARELGLGEVASRKKRAIQYGSSFLKAIGKLAAGEGYRYKREYLSTFYHPRAELNA